MVVNLPVIDPSSMFSSAPPFGNSALVFASVSPSPLPLPAAAARRDSSTCREAAARASAARALGDLAEASGLAEVVEVILVGLRNGMGKVGREVSNFLHVILAGQKRGKTEICLR